MKKIALATPLKDEIENLPRLIHSVESQSVKIYLWVIVENDSTDGSKEFLKNLHKIKNVENFHILNLSFFNKQYDVGYKYSKVVQKGFDFLKSSDYYHDLDYIGLLDSDTFPEEDFFEKLIRFMDQNQEIGLASGRLLLENGKKAYSNPDAVRGQVRLWSKKCFEETCYFYGLSPDSITQIKAEIKGWNPTVLNHAKFYSREPKTRTGYEIQGKSAYYVGYPFHFVLLKSAFYLFKRTKFIFPYFKGYLKSYIKRDAKSPDHEIIDYNKKRLVRFIKKKLSA